MGSITFSVKKFEPAPVASLRFNDMFRLRMQVESYMKFSSIVEVTDPDNVLCNEWEIGYIQTLFESKRSSFYSDHAGHEIYEYSFESYQLPANDVADDKSYWGWYGWFSPVTSANKVISATASDTPSSGGSYLSHNKKGSLCRVSGKDRFCTWLIARRSYPFQANAVSMGELRYLSWVMWEVDYTCHINPKLRRGTAGRGAGARITSSGQTDSAPAKPTLDHKCKDRETWYSLSHGHRTRTIPEP